ncbi:MAG: CocE/NonD family hydrolase [bacterium]
MRSGRSVSRLLGVLVFGAAIACLCGCGSDPDSRSSVEAGERIPLPELGPDEPYPVRIDRGVALVRGEGPQRTLLYADLFRPAAAGRFPVLIEAVAYRREIVQLASPDPAWLASQGYAVMLLDVRGTGSSEGRWGVFSGEEVDDIVWAIDEWIPAQPWSNGKAGMFGPSYMGILQYLSAARKPERLKAIFPGVAMADAYRDIFYQGGIFDQEFMLFWSTLTMTLSILPGTQLLTDPLSAMKALWEHWTRIPELLSLLQELSTDQEFFWERSPMYHWEALAGLPVFATAGWFCIFTRGSLLNYEGLDAVSRDRAPGLRPPRRLIVGPWYHTPGAMLEGVPAETLHKRWFDWHLKADEDPRYPLFDILDPAYPVCLYVMGAEQWRKERGWPLERARYETLYLSSRQQLDDRNPSLNNGTLLWPEERADQIDDAQATAPVHVAHRPPQFAGRYSRSTCRWLAGLTAWHPSAEDERQNELLTLTFSTARLSHDVEVTGPMVLRLWARTWFGPADPGSLPPVPIEPPDPDVHWIVNVNDVFPDGRVANVTSGWLAASHRPDPLRPDRTLPGYDPFDYPQDQLPALPREGELYEYVIEVWPASNLFRAGHQIRIDIANSDVPHLLPSPYASESEILCDRGHPSRLILPLVNPESTEPRQWVEDPHAYFSGLEPWEGL